MAAGGDVCVAAAELVLHDLLHSAVLLRGQAGLQQGHEELGELLRVLLHLRVQPELGDEVVGVDCAPVGELHHDEEELQAGHLSPGLVVAHQERLVLALFRVQRGVPLVQCLAEGGVVEPDLQEGVDVAGVAQVLESCRDVHLSEGGRSIHVCGGLGFQEELLLVAVLGSQPLLHPQACEVK